MHLERVTLINTKVERRRRKSGFYNSLQASGYFVFCFTLKHYWNIYGNFLNVTEFSYFKALNKILIRPANEMFRLEFFIISIRHSTIIPAFQKKKKECIFEIGTYCLYNLIYTILNVYIQKNATKSFKIFKIIKLY